MGMATLCKNCAHALIYDPWIKKMLCTTCGSTFEAEEVESGAKKFKEDESATRCNETHVDAREIEEKFLENYVYTCSECGGEIIIHGSEVSTKCIYCGNPNVVFSRVSKEKTPDYILPFSVTKEFAIRAVRSKMERARFVSKEIKNIRPEDVRGIYLPYWIVEADFEEDCLVSSTVGSGKSSTTIYSRRKGELKLKRFPVDGCRILSNESAARLEPFNLRSLIDFDEDYLMGFYSNGSDIPYNDLWDVTTKRCREFFEKEAMRDVPGTCHSIDRENHVIAIKNNYRYALLPVWFITFEYEGKQNTVLVNGQTGKVVCGLPWCESNFWSMTLRRGAVLTIPFFFVFLFLFRMLFESGLFGNTIIASAVAILVFFKIGNSQKTKVLEDLELTQSPKMFNFVKKRQE